ncbi:MAG TPA: peptide deformylase [Nitrospiria bacterium]|nr:peptide deformylase [Nitrospiria bacterium]
MSILKTSKLGNPILRQIAKEVPLSELKSPSIQKLIDDMIETMHEYDGVGLAAPQVHESKQIAVIEVHNSKRYPWAPDVPLLVLVNPVFLSKSEETVEGWEGCLSVESFRGKVPRSKKVSVRFLDRNGKEQKLEAEGFPAVVIQHELDHLAGKVFLDRMRDLSTLAHLKEYERFWMKPQDEEAE